MLIWTFGGLPWIQKMTIDISSNSLAFNRTNGTWIIFMG